MQWHPHTTVATVVERDGRFLMVEELVDGEIWFNQPAGHLEVGETLVEAAVRETLEETAWNVEPLALLGVYQSTSASSGICYIRTCFIARALNQVEGRALDTGIIRAHWLTHDEILQRRAVLRSPAVLAVLDDYIAGRRYPLSLIKTLE